VALHDEATRPEDTDWPQIKLLYEVLLGLADNPVVALNHAVAVAMVHGPLAGLALLDPLGKDDRLAADHRWQTARAHLLELAGDREGARSAYLTAATKTMSQPQQRYLHTRAARLAG
jgi:predicted RNA polymerase sigma factor